MKPFLRITGLDLKESDRLSFRQRLGTRLEKFAPPVRRASIRVKDVNGPRGGVDQRCRIKVVLDGLPTVMVENHARSARTAFHAALGAAERAVQRAVRRRRKKPIKAARRRVVQRA
jgi:hypothetical protein